MVTHSQPQDVPGNFLAQPNSRAEPEDGVTIELSVLPAHFLQGEKVNCTIISPPPLRVEGHQNKVRAKPGEIFPPGLSTGEATPEMLGSVLGHSQQEGH